MVLAALALPGVTPAAFSFFTPLFGMAADAVFLSEEITIALAVAMALVALGIYLVNRAPGTATSQ